MVLIKCPDKINGLFSSVFQSIKIPNLKKIEQKLQILTYRFATSRARHFLQYLTCFCLFAKLASCFDHKIFYCR